MQIVSSNSHIEKTEIELAFHEPVGCRHVACPSVRLGKAELDRLRRVKAQLKSSLEREHQLVLQKDEIIRHMKLLGQESDHRLMNGLQMVSSLLAMQGRLSKDGEAAAQLKIAAARVATIGSVQRSLHASDHIEKVDLTSYLQTLCQDISGVFQTEMDENVIDVQGIRLLVPSFVGSSLGFVVSELVTNAAKHASGTISVNLIENPGSRYTLTVSDLGAGLPPGFDPKKMKGLGMKIILALIEKIGGSLSFSSGANGLGTKFSVSFSC